MWKWRHVSTCPSENETKFVVEINLLYEQRLIAFSIPNKLLEKQNCFIVGDLKGVVQKHMCMIICSKIVVFSLAPSFAKDATPDWAKTVWKLNSIQSLSKVRNP